MPFCSRMISLRLEGQRICKCSDSVEFVAAPTWAQVRPAVRIDVGVARRCGCLRWLVRANLFCRGRHEAQQKPAPLHDWQRAFLHGNFLTGECCALSRPARGPSRWFADADGGRRYAAFRNLREAADPSYRCCRGSQHHQRRTYVHTAHPRQHGERRPLAAQRHFRQQGWTSVTSFVSLCGRKHSAGFEREFRYLNCNRIRVIRCSYLSGVASLLILRRSEPDLLRPYKAWWYPWSTIIVLLASAAFLLGSVIGLILDEGTKLL
jgi:hypothetical protein